MRSQERCDALSSDDWIGQKQRQHTSFIDDCYQTHPQGGFAPKKYLLHENGGVSAGETPNSELQKLQVKCCVFIDYCVSYGSLKKVHLPSFSGFSGSTNHISGHGFLPKLGEKIAAGATAIWSSKFQVECHQPRGTKSISPASTMQACNLFPNLAFKICHGAFTINGGSFGDKNQAFRP